MNRVKQIWDAQEKAYRKMMEDEQYCHHESFRWGFEQGVDWAEKDLALTWEDITTLIRLCEQVKTEWWFKDMTGIGTQKHFEEVLRRFNEQRKK